MRRAFTPVKIYVCFTTPATPRRLRQYSTQRGWDPASVGLTLLLPLLGYLVSLADVVEPAWLGGVLGVGVVVLGSVGFPCFLYDTIPKAITCVR
jgi:hypothetical protein